MKFKYLKFGAVPTLDFMIGDLYYEIQGGGRLKSLNVLIATTQPRIVPFL